MLVPKSRKPNWWVHGCREHDLSQMQTDSACWSCCPIFQQLSEVTISPCLRLQSPKTKYPAIIHKAQVPLFLLNSENCEIHKLFRFNEMRNRVSRQKASILPKIDELWQDTLLFWRSELEPRELDLPAGLLEISQLGCGIRVNFLRS